MNLILGMDYWVFAAWFLTIISAISCVLYDLYHEYIKKSLKEEKKEKSPIEEAK